MAEIEVLSQVDSVRVAGSEEVWAGQVVHPDQVILGEEYESKEPVASKLAFVLVELVPFAYWSGWEG